LPDILGPTGVPYAVTVNQTGGAQSPPGREQALAHRILAFAGLPFLGLLTPFLFLPVLSRLAGADAWLAIAVGQSVGGFAGLVVALGFNTVGPTAVARATPQDRPDLLRRSLAPRALVFLPAAAVAAVVAVLLAPQAHRLEAGLMAVALTLFGLSPSWFMVGLGRASRIVLVDILPRLAATLAAAGVLVVTGSAVAYPVLLILATIFSAFGYAAKVVGLRRMFVATGAEVRATLAGARSALAIELAGGAYNALAVAFVTGVATAAQAASYVSGDKLYRVGQYSASALGNALQGWAVEAGETSFARRVRLALVAHLALGLLGFGAFALVGAPLSGWLFGPHVAIDELTALGFGVAAFNIVVGTGLGRVVLVALGARRQFLASVLVGASFGVPSILLLAAGFGAAGGAWGLAIGESASVICQGAFALRAWRRRHGEN
jgi:O-antigen/teichoic acid export membrane protein